MVKLSSERLWLLKRFPKYGWSGGYMSFIGVKKWDAHRAALLKAGLLEKDDYGMFRVIDAGRSALQHEGK